MESAESEFILRIRRIFLSPCNCNDDLYLDKRIDFLPRISRHQEQQSIVLFVYLLFRAVCVHYFYRESFKGRIHGCSISTLYIFIKEWIGRIERESMTCKWMMETLSVEASRVRVHQEGPPPVFFTTSRSGTVINFLHLRFECLLDILSLFHISRVMDGSIGIHELSSIL